MTSTTTRRRDAVRRVGGATAVAIILATLVAGPAIAGSGTIDCNGSDRAISNYNDGGTRSVATTASNGQCGNVKISSKVYVGGGVYAWDTPESFGTTSGVKLHIRSATLSHSKHYWDFLGNPTSKTLSV